LTKIGLRPKMIFMDIGCGDGFFTIPAAELVGENGRVFAVDTDGVSVERLKLKAAEKGLKNVVASVGKAEETVFCEECADIVFFSIVLHDFRDPTKVLQNAKRMVKLRGKLVNLDWKKKAMPFGPPKHIRFSEEEARKLICQEGFKIESITDQGKYFYLIIAKP